MNSKVIIIVAIAAVIVVGGGLAAYFLLFATPAEPTPAPLFTYMPGDYFVTNIMDSKALLKVTVVLVINDEKQLTYLSNNEYILRDTVIAVLRDKTEDELRAPDATDMLREDLVNALRDDLGMDYLVTLYFNDYVLQ